MQVRQLHAREGVGIERVELLFAESAERFRRVPGAWPRTYPAIARSTASSSSGESAIEGRPRSMSFT
jgi:hypothetical protein